MLCETLPRLEADEYPGGLWYYEPHTYQPYRYVLGRVGRRPLVCIGINPSTAQPGALDPTLKSVERLANANGFDSWIMFNVYPQRATNPNDMDKNARPRPLRRKISAGCRPCWPRPSPPCGPHGVL